MRRHNMGTVIDEMAELDTDSDRSKTAITKTAGGLLKLLYPCALSDSPDAEGFAAILDVAVSCRKLVLEQLAAMLPGEYDTAGIHAGLRQ